MIGNFEQPYFVADDDPRPDRVLLADASRKASYRALFSGDPAEAHIYAPVLGLTMFSVEDGRIDEILVGVRDPEENMTHPNVVSTPTMRFNRFIAENAARQPLAGATPRQHKFRLSERGWVLKRDDPEADGSGMTGYVNSVLFSKLGIGLNDRAGAELEYMAVPHSLTLGNSRVGVTDDWQHDIIEKVAMYNVLVRVFQDYKHLIPNSTRHYSDLRWVTPDEYREMQDSKNLLPVFDEQAAKLCIHGVCIQTSRNALDDLDEFNRLVLAGS